MRIKYIISISVITLFFSACGGGGGSFSNAQEKVDINVTCVDNPSAANIDSYITIQSGDTLIKEEDNTSVSIYHDLNDIKKVCLVSGSAYLLKK